MASPSLSVSLFVGYFSKRAQPPGTRAALLATIPIGETLDDLLTIGITAVALPLLNSCSGKDFKRGFGAPKLLAEVA